MIKLETQFVSGKGGYSTDPLTYKQLVRNEKFAIYQRFYSDGRSKDFEVIKIRIIPAGHVIFNSAPSTEDSEEYAVTSMWGKTGWTFHNRTAAQNKYDELCKSADTAEDTEESVKEAYSLPLGLFTIKHVAELNEIPYPYAATFVKEMLEKGAVKFEGEKHLHARGKASKIFSKTS